MTKYTRGSEWRKWDLHVHTPLSIVQEYGGDTEDVWNRYIDALKNLPEEIKVIGITDYLFIDGYKKVLDTRSQLNNLDLIIPNIEFRLDLFNAQNKRLNLHVLFSDEVSPEVIQEQLLSCLSKAYRISDASIWQQTPTRRSLEELGKQIKSNAVAGNSIHSKTDLRVGFENITYKLEDILKELDKDCFKDKYVLSLGYTEWDQFKWDQSAAEKRNVINKIDFLLTNNPTEDTISSNQKNLLDNSIEKPILHSSDSHTFDDLNKSMLWIKADPTFTGLKQVLNDYDRVFIGTQYPSSKNDFNIISKIEVTNSNNWFENNFSLPINKDMVTIIGGRGSGKSALIEMIAYGCNSEDTSGESFIGKAQKHKESIKGAKIKITWENGDEDQVEIGGLTDKKSKVQFLPQKSVEQLCSPEGIHILQNQIENVIFNSLDETEKYEASNFQDLLKNILSEFNVKKENLGTRIQNQVNELITLTREVNSLDKKKLEVTALKETLVKLNKELIKLPENVEKEQEELMSLLELEILLREKIVDLKNSLQKIETFEAKISEIKKQIGDLQTNLSRELNSSGFAIPNDLELKLSLDDLSFQKYFNEQKELFNNQINLLIKADTLDSFKEIFPDYSKTFFNYSTVKNSIELLKGKTKIYESQKQKYQEQKKEILELEKKIKTCEEKIKYIEEKSIPEKLTLQTDLFSKYSEIFAILREERKRLDELYSPLQRVLDGGSTLDKLLKFNAEFYYDFRLHSNNGLNILDRTKKGNFKDNGSLETRLQQYWKDISDENFDPQIIKDKLLEIIKEFTQHEGVAVSIDSQLKNGYAIEDFYKWLFDITNFNIKTSILFNQISLEILSPGQKGIVLLMLYLAIDNQDKRPLLIDQPEDNLDNLSIYNDVIKYFRNRKLNRQIIVVTHNPNLVVNTDSEQVIVANYDGSRNPRIQYKTGSLENHSTLLTDTDNDLGIIEEVCDILEGGEKPFKKRKDKYNLSPKINLVK
jgi:ABC-type lipoprotein export system ATPase subunit